MIPYQKAFLGVNLIFRVHGSPIYKAVFPGFISVLMYFLLDQWILVETDASTIIHPYGVGVLISSVSFLIIFRANYGYQRYWNACGDVHFMMSKWLDAVVHTSVFHMQQSHYDHIKPPTYYENHDLNTYNLKGDREREVDLDKVHNDTKLRRRRRKTKSIEPVMDDTSTTVSEYNGAYNDDSYLVGKGRLDGGWGLLFDDDLSTFHKINSDNSKKYSDWNKDMDRGFASTAGGRTPSLFLQELAHLASLCNAVAMSTLRNDVEGAESPLDVHEPGAPFPETDPDQLPREVKEDMGANGIGNSLRYLMGLDKNPVNRTRYNAARPLQVLGGVSENEIKFLQRAKGPSAKVTLAWNWLSEFIIREHLAGSLGKVGPPIISRIIQFLSDGMRGYNDSRKVVFVPFPFPHAQLSALFVITIIFAVPLLMAEYTGQMWIGAVLTFTTVVCLAGLHEVGRELENPFRNVPNELPLCTFQAMFNESLITMFAGYHPDLYWDSEAVKASRAKAEDSVRSIPSFFTKSERNKSMRSISMKSLRSMRSMRSEKRNSMRSMRNERKVKSERVDRKVEVKEPHESTPDSPGGCALM